MSKKHFIELAARIRSWNRTTRVGEGFSEAQLNLLADFLKWTNPRFNRERWLAYIAGECGPNGGAVKK